jgi:hypothetical protein
MSTLSELSRTYMEFVEDIRAGERALADDVSRMLAHIAQGRADGTIATASALERAVEAGAGSTFTLRLLWDTASGWPNLSLHVAAEAGLFDPAILRGCMLGQPDRGALLTDPVAELSRVWDEGLARQEAWLGAPEVQTRVGALSVLKQLSARLRATLKPKPAGFTQAEAKVSGSVPNFNFPAYVEWYDQDGRSGKRISWELLYHYEDRPNRPAGLQLVCFNGAYAADLLQDHPAIGTYLSHPILAAWPERLAAVIARQETAQAAASSILGDVSRIYEGYRRRLNGGTV